MNALWRLTVQELGELTRGMRGPLLVLVVPVVVVLLVGQLQVQPAILRTLVVGAAASDDALQARERSLLVRLLVEAAAFDVATREGGVIDPLLGLREGDHDLLIVAEDDAAGAWRIFSAETNPRRLGEVELAIAGLERALPLVLEQAAAEHEGAEYDSGQALVRQLGALSTVSTGRRFLYYPEAARRAYATVPMTMGLIVCFLPFVLVAPAFLRDRETRMWEVKLAAPGVRPVTVFAGRCVAAVLATLLSLLAMLAAAWLAYGLAPKPGFLAVAAALLPALLSAAFLGVGVSRLAHASSQVTAASAAWFLWLLLTSGVLFTLQQASTTLQLLSHLSPLTPVHTLLNTWMFGAGITLTPLPTLALQCALYLLLATLPKGSD